MANHGFIYIKVIKPIALFVSGSANVFHNELMEYEFSFLFWWLKRRWVNLEVLDLGVKNRGGGMKMFRAKLE